MTADFRAMKARQLLDDEVLQAAFAAIERRALDEALSVPAWHGPVGDRRRRRALERVRMISELRSELQTVVLTGAQAARPLSGAV